eukprot:g54077.t1
MMEEAVVVPTSPSPGASRGDSRIESKSHAQPPVFNSMSEPEEEGQAAFSSTVSDPTNVGDGLSQFTIYQVTSVFRDSEDGREVSVQRRYNDFVWLRASLQRKNLGVLVPPIPEKVFTTRFTGDVVAERQRGLQRFLNRLAVHPVLKDSPDIVIFLQESNPKVLATHVEQEDSEDRSSVSSAFINWIQNSFNQTFGDKRTQTEDDIKCDKVYAYAVKLEESQTAVHQQVEKLSARNKALSRCYFDFGNHCSALGEFEGKAQEPKLASVFAKLGNVADTLCVLLQQKTEKEQVEFQEAVRDQLLMVKAVREMVKSRSVALDSFHVVSQELESKKSKLAQIETDTSKMSKVALLQKEIVALQETVEHKQEELDTITKLLFAETNRFRREKERAFQRIVLNYIQAQIEHSRKVQKAWESILPELEAL